MSEEVVGKCKVCKLDIVKHSFSDIDSYNYCSDFCDYTSDKEKIDFLGAAPGDFIIYPCADCGVAIEDEWTPDSCCSKCSESRKIATQKEIISLQDEVIVDLISKCFAFKYTPEPEIQSKLNKISELKKKLK